MIIALGIKDEWELDLETYHKFIKEVEETKQIKID